MSRRLLLIAAVALLPMMGVLILNLVNLRSEEGRRVHDEALRVAELVSLEMDQVIGGTENLLRAIGAAPVVQLADAAGCAAYLARVLEQLPQFVSISVIDGDGIIRCMPGETTETFVGDRSYFTEAQDTGALVVGEFNEGRVTNRPSLAISIPLVGSSGWAGGVVVTGLDLDWLGTRLRDRSFALGSAITIADRNGRILAREPFPERFVGTVIPDAFQHLVHADAPGSIELTSQDGTRRIIGYRPVGGAPKGLYVSAGLSTEDAFGALDRATSRGVAIVLASILLSLLLARSTSEAFITRPFGVLVDTIDKWRGADMTARTGMTAADGELGAVGKAIDTFMDELAAERAQRRKSEQQRELLLQELDHRVKNLLATVQAVARQSFPRSARNDSAEVFIKRLATMSAAHGLLMRDEWQEAELRRLIEIATEPFANPDRSQFTISGPDLVLNSNAVLALGMALHELCTNSVKYGALSSPKGEVSILWETAPDEAAGGGSFRLVWRETGGPPVVAPTSKGFGSRMIEQALAHQIGGDVSLDYRSEGLVCRVVAPLEIIGSRRDPAA